VQRRQQWLRIGIRNRQHWNLGDGLGVFEIEALGARHRADSRRERIAGIIRVHHASALHALPRPPAALGIVFAVEKSVAAGIRVNNAPDGAVLAGDFWLDAAPSLAVTRNHD